MDTYNFNPKLKVIRWNEEDIESAQFLFDILYKGNNLD